MCSNLLHFRSWPQHWFPWQPAAINVELGYYPQIVMPSGIPVFGIYPKRRLKVRERCLKPITSTEVVKAMRQGRLGAAAA